MALSIQDSRILLKRSTNTSEVPTAAPSNDFTDGTWTSLDVYVGEAFANTVDEKLWLRFTNNIRQIAVADSPTTNRLTYWNASGHLGNVAAPTTDTYLKYTNASGYHWAAAGGAESQDWNDVLTLSRFTDGVNPFVSAGDAIEWHNTTANFVTTLTNDQATAANRTVYLPAYDGTITYKTTTLNSNYILKGTTNEAVVSSSLIYDNGTNVGIGTASPIFRLSVEKNTNAFNQMIFATNTSGGNSAAATMGVFNGTYYAELGILGSGYSAATQYGGSNDGYLYYNRGGNFNFVSNALGVNWNFHISTAATTPMLSIQSTNGVGINTSSQTAALHIKGFTSDNTAYALKVANSSSTKLIFARNDGQIELYDGGSISLGTTTGVKIGIGTTDKLGFWNTTPIVQPTTGITAATFTANTSGIADDTATFDGYTIGQVVKALRNTGLLA